MEGLPLLAPKKAHNVRVVNPSEGFFSVPSPRKGEGSMTCRREDSSPVHVAMELNIDGLTADQIHISGYSGVRYDAAC